MFDCLPETKQGLFSSTELVQVSQIVSIRSVKFEKVVPYSTGIVRRDRCNALYSLEISQVGISDLMEYNLGQHR